MSELIISSSPSDSPVSFADYKVQVSNPAGSVTLRIPPNSPAGTVEVITTSGNTFVTSIDLNDPTIFNILGGTGADILKTAAGADSIAAGLGDDVVSAGDGNDFVDGGAGNNLLQGEGLNDFLLSGDGNDTLQGGSGTDLLVSGAGNDSLDGGADNDVLISGAGNDTLVGGAGNDRLQGGPGKDSLIGGDGIDRFRFEKGAIGKGKNLKQVDEIADFDPDGEVLEFAKGVFKGNKVKPADVDANEFGCRPLMNEADFATVQSISEEFGSAKIVYEQDTGLVYFNSKQGPTALVQLEAGLNLTASNFELFY